MKILSRHKETPVTGNPARPKFGIDRKSFFGNGAMILLTLAIIFRIIGCWGRCGEALSFIMNFVLPSLSCLLYVLCIVLFGRKGFFLSFLPVTIGAVFFAFTAFGCGNMVLTVLIVLFCAAAAVIYTSTMFGAIRTKWLLPPLFAIPLVYLLIRDFPALVDAADPVSFSVGMQKMASFCMLLGMTAASLGIKKRTLPQLPVVEGEIAESYEEPEETGEAADEEEACTVNEEVQTDVQTSGAQEAEAEQTAGEAPGGDAAMEPAAEEEAQESDNEE